MPFRLDFFLLGLIFLQPNSFWRVRALLPFSTSVTLPSRWVSVTLTSLSTAWPSELKRRFKATVIVIAYILVNSNLVSYVVVFLIGYDDYSISVSCHRRSSKFI